MSLDDKIPGAPNFTWRELIRSNTAEQKGINNVPTDKKILDNLQYLAETCLQPARIHFGVPIKINSGYRSPALNVSVGGSASSFHSHGCAADVEFVSGGHTLFDLFTFFCTSTSFTELIAEEIAPGSNNQGWIHIAVQKGREQEKATKYKLPGKPVKRASFDEIKQIFGIK